MWINRIVTPGAHILCCPERIAYYLRIVEDETLHTKSMVWKSRGVLPL